MFHSPTQEWFDSAFDAATPPQTLGWPAIASGQHTLLLAPTGTGKTLAAFLYCIDRLLFTPPPDPKRRCRVLYISPLKALAVDVERNLRTPLAGIARVAGTPPHLPTIGVRTGDTPQLERARFLRQPTDILITTPESLYLMLTGRAREMLRSIDTVIIDEIHALVPTKRGAHLMLTLERLEAIVEKPFQRIGLSATQRPLEEVARFLGGTKRSVRIVDAGSKKKLSLRIDVPVEDMAKIGQIQDIPSGAASQGPVRSSIWQAIHPRLLELVKAHTSTLVFVNSRRIAERLAAALNELAGETVAYAHHGSLAREQRTQIEDRLKAGQVKALVATSSLELGIDMGAIDLVVQIEAPPTVASGLQRIGRAGHSVGVQSQGVIFPKFRGDLLACAALTQAMQQGEVESIHYPRNPLDVLAQQIVAMVGMDTWDVGQLFDRVRECAAYADLTRTIFDNLLDMLAGRYASDELSELKPRITWDRVRGLISAREGAKKVAISNGGTIPDRGLYGVFLAAADKKGARVGELDEEMVFESKPGETFVLGASTWRIEEITFDKVLVSPAPGEPGRMPFWRGEAAGRSLEFGRKIGALTRELTAMTPAMAEQQLTQLHGLDLTAAKNLVQYLEDQKAATRAVPDDRTLIVERCRDELGDWRVCVLSPLGGQVHAPWSMAAVAKVRAELGIDVESLWTNDGFVVRFPDSDVPPDPQLLLPSPAEIEALVTQKLGHSALFAAHFRENASRALLLPKRRPGQRAPLWQQRKRASDLLSVAAQFQSFPIVLETYRECLRDVFDLPALTSLLRDVEARTTRLLVIDSDTPSPFASALLFGFVANYIYEGDAPLAERRAQALAIDQAQLRELLGEAELRELLDADAMAAVEAQLQQVDERYRAKTADGLHDMLMRLGDLDEEQIKARAFGPVEQWLKQLVQVRRLVPVKLGGKRRYIAAEDAARYRDALGVALQPGLPDRLLDPVADPLRDLVLRHARTHAPFTLDAIVERFALGKAVAEAQVRRLVAEGKLLEGAFVPGGMHREYSDPEVLRTIRRKSLAKLRREIEPVDPPVLARFLSHWHNIHRPRQGMDALLDAIEKLQGAPIPASILESEVLASRVANYNPNDLDALLAAGEVVWCGIEPIGERDGRLALYLTDHLSRLWEPPTVTLDEREQRIFEYLQTRGASFFAALNQGFPADTTDALWSLVWKGLVTNDAFRPLRARLRGSVSAKRRGFRSRRLQTTASEGRWSLVAARVVQSQTQTERAVAHAEQLLQRYGVVTREVATVEGIRGGFSAVYDVFKTLEESGRIRRGYFVGGVGAMQFALPHVLEQLRALKVAPEVAETVHLAATDPANPYGALLKWPQQPAQRSTLQRSAGAIVILVDGTLAGYLSRGGRQLQAFLPEAEPERTRVARALAGRLKLLASLRGLVIAEADGLQPFLRDEGFLDSPQGYYLPTRARITAVIEEEEETDA